MDVVCVCQTQSSSIFHCAFVTVSKLTIEHFHIHNWISVGHFFDRCNNCILLQDRRQQRILITSSRPMLVLKDSFSLPSSSHNSLTSLNISARHLDGRYGFVVQNWRIPPQNGNLLLRFEELNSKVNLSLRIELIERSALIIYTDFWAVCLFISPLVPLHPVVGLRPPSNSFKEFPWFSHSASLCLLRLCLILSKTQLQKAFSLYAGALSLWHSLPQ